MKQKSSFKSTKVNLGTGKGQLIDKTREEKNKEVVKGIFELINTLNNIKKISPELFLAIIKAVV